MTEQTKRLRDMSGWTLTEGTQQQQRVQSEYQAALAQAADTIEALEARIREDEERIEALVRTWHQLATERNAAEAKCREAERERDVYAELAGGKSVISKVIKELGPQSLMPSAELRRLREAEARIAALERVAEDAETLTRVVGKRGPYPTEDEWSLIVSASNALRAALSPAPARTPEKSDG